MFKFSAKEDKFYDLFILFAENIHKSSEMLKDFVYDLDHAEEKLKAIKDTEVKCDHTLHEIFTELNKTFLTPIDREDIYTIGKQMDDIADYIEATASRFVMFNVHKATPEAKTLSDLVLKGTEQVIELMQAFKVVKKGHKLLPVIVEINRLEEEVDAIYRKAIRKLFSDTAIPILDVIKWREIYEHLENILDACEDVANTVEGVVMKHA
ncbi:DUF47 domain-containing protein [Candidatus Formimonas warabiya]|uniref:Phosphate transport regulator n=1 Tax=Formimonas warabiya TaxID=1761012 RepID=A0A3G1KTB4_FORW1|nr:DUF47 domain-containing protein [Candidatus Formimonas warabiya]ATW25708.1 phosphate transport regulator [Candidatus Formimonas warabiya]